MSDVLNEVEIEIQDQFLCQRVYNSIAYDIYPGQICGDAPAGNFGSCVVRNIIISFGVVDLM